MLSLFKVSVVSNLPLASFDGETHVPILNLPSSRFTGKTPVQRKIIVVERRLAVLLITLSAILRSSKLPM